MKLMVLFFGMVCFASASKALEPEWEKRLQKQGVTPREIAVLKEKKLLVSGQQLFQVFEPYTKMEMPAFITSDSLLTGFNALVQESLRLLELRQSQDLRRVLSFFQRSITERRKGYLGTFGSTASTEAGILRARMLVAVAQRLLGDLDAIPQDLRAEAAACEKILLGPSGIYLPTWLGKPDAGFLGIDTSRMKPVGFYMGDADLQRVFRTVSWLQSVPLMVDDEASLVAISVLGNAMGGTRNYQEHRLVYDSLRSYEQFFGSGGVLTLHGLYDEWPFKYEHESYEGASVKRPTVKDRREKLLELAIERSGGQGTSNDLFRVTPDGLNLRVWPTSELPDHSYLHAAGRTGPEHIRGLEIAAALGSAIARRGLEKSLGSEETARRLKIAERSGFKAALSPPRKIYDHSGDERDKPRLGPPSDLTNWAFESSFYQRYLSCLAALTDDPEKGAPALFSSEAWQAKSCLTVLSGWALMRHTTALAARYEVNLLSASPPEPGYVEPDPDFFEMLGNLASEWHQLFKDRGTFEESEERLIQRVRDDFDWLESQEQAGPPDEGRDVRLISAQKRLYDAPWPKSVPLPEELKTFFVFDEKQPPASITDPIEQQAWQLRNNHEQTLKFEAKLRIWRQQAQVWLEERIAQNALPASFVHYYSDGHRDLDERWQTFVLTCQKLESMAHRQLRGEPLSDLQRSFVLNYGIQLARLMGYEGNHYLIPNDDAPVCAQILHDPVTQIRRHVGVDRPRVLYLLYPTSDGEVLLRGAVNSYAERDSSEPLTDFEWHKIMHETPADSSGWLKPISPESARIPSER